MQIYVAEQLQQPKRGRDRGQPRSGPQICSRQPVAEHRAAGGQTGAVHQLRRGRGGVRGGRRAGCGRGEGRDVRARLHGGGGASLQDGGRGVCEGGLRTESVRGDRRQSQLVCEGGPAESAGQPLRGGERRGETRRPTLKQTPFLH